MDCWQSEAWVEPCLSPMVAETWKETFVAKRRLAVCLRHGGILPPPLFHVCVKTSSQRLLQPVQRV
eukprot:CAMPEP_0203946264 /NCGR_PEP_ID=MMETSP0359-20131031/81572_1 /ASSEMBLY_ACC=CAM_ASM_000338 /TAXON_ID=268821 /ORGANISM="Scrippsiella Hangoei, Strain SHTV-5" /LENGTH=65 /DNA_ID=CAMNT_0050877535 /DNA_START=382 /DNA_END=579 /DNA_ORIENTATION=+